MFLHGFIFAFGFGVGLIFFSATLFGIIFFLDGLERKSLSEGNSQTIDMGEWKRRWLLDCGKKDWARQR